MRALRPASPITEAEASEASGFSLFTKHALNGGSREE